MIGLWMWISVGFAGVETTLDTALDAGHGVLGGRVTDVVCVGYLLDEMGNLDSTFQSSLLVAEAEVPDGMATVSQGDSVALQWSRRLVVEGGDEMGCGPVITSIPTGWEGRLAVDEMRGAWYVAQLVEPDVWTPSEASLPPCGEDAQMAFLDDGRDTGFPDDTMPDDGWEDALPAREDTSDDASAEPAKGCQVASASMGGLWTLLLAVGAVVRRRSFRG